MASLSSPVAGCKSVDPVPVAQTPAQPEGRMLNKRRFCPLNRQHYVLMEVAKLACLLAENAALQAERCTCGECDEAAKEQQAAWTEGAIRLAAIVLEGELVHPDCLEGRDWNCRVHADRPGGLAKYTKYVTGLIRDTVGGGTARQKRRAKAAKLPPKG